MGDYEAMRHFADSWGLLFLFLVFVGVIAWLWLRPGSKTSARDAKDIPFKEYPQDDAPPRDQEKR
jgi:cytochrome c oxidase cbb3-type subunit 4